jgi:hypothetical protein
VTSMKLNERDDRYRQAYLAMAEEANHRPAAPNDGCGNILLELDDLRDPVRLEEEACKYALMFAREEDKRRFCIGCSHFPTNRAFVWVIEAARQLASGDDGNATALKLLAMER